MKMTRTSASYFSRVVEQQGAAELQPTPSPAAAQQNVQAPTPQSQDLGGFNIVEMLFATNLLAIVGTGEQPPMYPRCLCLFNTKTGASKRDLNFKTSILVVRLSRKRIGLVYDLSSTTILEEIETVPNTKELKEVLRTVLEVQELVGKEESRKLLSVKEQDEGIGVTYNQTFPEILRGMPVQPYVTRYTPSTDEFEVDRYLLSPEKSVTMSLVPGPSIFIVMTGEGEIQAGFMTDSIKAKEGDVFFVPAHAKVKLYTSCTRSMQLYRAGVNAVS